MGSGGGEGTGETRRFRTAKFVQFRHLRLKFFNDISSQTVLRVAVKLDWRHQTDIGIQNC